MRKKSILRLVSESRGVRPLLAENGSEYGKHEGARDGENEYAYRMWINTIPFDSNTKTWGLATLPTAISQTRNPELFPRTKTKPPALGTQMPLRQGEADARQWSINPFGDLDFAIDPSGVKQAVLVIPGLGPDTAVDELYRRIAVVNED
jgi:hypothetical protein